MNHNTKLTLSINQDVLSSAKEHLTGTQSLSGLVEDYFRVLVSRKNKSTHSKNPITQELTGIIKTKKTTDPDKARLEYILEKYS